MSKFVFSVKLCKNYLTRFYYHFSKPSEEASWWGSWGQGWIDTVKEKVLWFFFKCVYLKACLFTQWQFHFKLYVKLIKL